MHRLVRALLSKDPTQRPAVDEVRLPCMPCLHRNRNHD
jgi:hypothetical protein